MMAVMSVALMDGDTRAEYEHDIDVALAGSFPASDPLPWTLGVSEMREPHLARPHAAAEDVIVDSSAARRRLASFAELFGLLMLVPIAILLIGMPIAAAVRAAVAVVMRLNP